MEYESTHWQLSLVDTRDNLLEEKKEEIKQCDRHAWKDKTGNKTGNSK